MLVRLEDEFKQIEFIVQDTGIGIEQDKIRQILNQDSATNDELDLSNGSGYSLILCQQLINKIGVEKSFKIESAHDEGSRFSFKIYLQLSEPCIHRLLEHHGSSNLDDKSVSINAAELNRSYDQGVNLVEL